MRRIVRTPRSRRDALDIWLHIAANDISAADRLLDKLDETLRSLAESPEMGRARPELLPMLRSFPVGSYLLFYRPRRDGIELLRIVHGARRLRSLFER